MQREQSHHIGTVQSGDQPISLIGDQSQIFQIQGNLYYQIAPPQEVQQELFPLAPIPEPGVIVGREELVESVEQFFQDQTLRVLLIEGMGGIGKTAFGAYVSRRFRDVFQDVYWGICTEESTVERFLGELSALLSRNNEKLSEKSWNQPRCSLHTTIQVLLEKFEMRPYLLVFDDFQTLLTHDGQIKSAEVETLFQEFLRARHQSKLLMLSRRSLLFPRQPAGVMIRKRMEGLTVSATQTLLRQFEMRLSEPQLRALHQKVEGHPLVLRVLADLSHRGLGIDKLLTIPFRNLSRESKEVFDSLFAELWKIMGVEEKEVLQSLSTYRLPVPLEAIQALQPEIEDTEGEPGIIRLQHVIQLLGEHCLIVIRKCDHDTSTYTVPRLLKEFIFRGLTKMQQQKYHALAAAYWLTREWNDEVIECEGLRGMAEARYHAFQAGEHAQATQVGLSLAERLCRCGLCTMAKDVLLETMPIVSSPQDLATVYNDLGNVCIYQGEYPQASAYYEQARDIYEELGLEKYTAISYNNIGTVCASQGEYGQALTHYTRSRNILEGLQLLPELATSYNNIGFVYASLGEYRQALTYHEQAREIQECLSLEADLASSYNNIGFIYDCQRQYDLAVAYYERARTIRERLGLEVDLAESYNNIGYLYASQHQFDQALYYYKLSQEILERLGLEVNLARSYNNIALVYTTQGQSISALCYYERAREIQERLGLEVDLARTYNNLGCIYAAWRNLAQALWYYERAREIQERLGLETHLAITLSNLGQLYYEQGQYRKAEHALHLTIHIHENRQHPDLDNDLAFLDQIRERLYEKRGRMTRMLKTLKRIFKE